MKSIYCNCSVYLGEREGFDVIRCKKCGIDYIVNPKEFVKAVSGGDFAINVTSDEEYDIVVKFLESITKEEHNDDNIDYNYCCNFEYGTKDICLSICDNEWVHASKEEEEEHNVKVIEYQSIKDLIEKELDK